MAERADRARPDEGAAPAAHAASPAIGTALGNGALHDAALHDGVAANPGESLATPSVQKPAIFIIGCQRSGTTLLRYIIDSHEAFACPPESKFITGLRSFLQHPQVFMALRGLGFTRAQIYAHLRAFIQNVMGEYARRKGKPRWADKTPNYYKILEFIDDVFERQVRFVFIVRHPFDTVDSIATFLHPEQYLQEDGEMTEAFARHGAGRYGAAKYWNEVNERILVFASAHPDRTLLIRYEDLVSRPEATVKRVMALLQEPYRAEIIDNAFTAPHDPGGADLKITKTDRIETKFVGRWKQNWSSAEQRALWPVVAPLALQFGYEPPVASGPSPSGEPLAGVSEYAFGAVARR